MGKTIKVKRLTAAQFRKELRSYTREDLSSLLEGVYTTSPEAANYFNIRIKGTDFESALLKEAKENLRDCFYTKRGKAKLNLPRAKEVISDFEKAGPSLTGIIDLRLCCLEYGIDIINNYTRLPSSLFSSTDRMLQSIGKVFQNIDDSEEGTLLADQFRGRLENAVKGYNLEEQWFFDQLEKELREMRWLSASSAGSEEAVSSSVKEYEDSVLAPLTDSAPVLPEEDVTLYYDLWFPLLDFVNERCHINELRDLRQQPELDPAEVKDIADALWADVTLIDEYLAGPGAGLSPEHKSIVSGWKNCVSGRFVLERHLKKGSILISIEDNTVYQVRGIKSSWEEMFFYMQPPIMIVATLLPYRGIIISDGLVSSMPLSFGGGIKKTFRDQYNSAKTRKQIITSLPSAAGC